jgi:hypothetical protein
MADVDIEWVKSQLEAVKVRKMVGDAVIKLIDTWADVAITDKLSEEALDIFNKLSRNQPLIEVDKNEVWVPVTPGQIKVADEVRVKSDAYSGDLGRLHNGRRGRVVGVRYGDVIVKSTDNKKPVLDGAHYSPYILEKLVK